MFCIKHKYHVFIAIATSSQFTACPNFSFVKHSYTSRFYSFHYIISTSCTPSFTESMKTNVKSIEYGKLFPVGVMVCSVYERKRSHKVNE